MRRYIMMCLAAAAACCGDSQVDVVAYVHLDHRPKYSKLHSGDVVEGSLLGSLYAGDQKLFPAGSRVRLTIDGIEKHKKAALPQDRPFVLRLLAPRHEAVPLFRAARIAPPGGADVPATAAFVRLARTVEVRAKSSRPGAPAVKTAAKGGLVMVVKLGVNGLAAQPPALDTSPSTLAAGTHAELILMQNLSASKNRRGDVFEARLSEPLRQGDRVVIPAGSVFEGLITRSVAPRRLSRPGSLLLSFTRLTLPGGAAAPLLATPASVEAEAGSRLRMDPEGGLHAGGPGVARLMLEAGLTAGIAKVADDGTQLVIELLVSTATDASTAGTARIVAACASGLFLLTRHGRDVILPEYTRLDVVLNRPLPVPGRTK